MQFGRCFVEILSVTAFIRSMIEAIFRNGVNNQFKEFDDDILGRQYPSIGYVCVVDRLR